MYRNDVQPVVQVFPEVPFLHPPQQVGVGRRDHPHVDLPGLVAADALERALLQGAQQLGLQARAHRADFVEEQRAAVRLLQPPRPTGERAGERAPDVPEQLRLEQRVRNGAAVDRHQPLVAARTVVVDGARHQFLARAGLAGDQNRARRAGHGLEELEEIAHRTTASDDALEPIPIPELRPEVLVLGLQPPLLQRRRQDVQQVVEGERLHHEVGGPALDGGDRVLHRAVAGDDHRHDLRIALERELDHFGAVDAGQPQIGDDRVEGEVGQQVARSFAALRFRHAVAVLDEALGRRFAKRLLVLDEEQVPFWFRHGGMTRRGRCRYLDAPRGGGQAAILPRIPGLCRRSRGSRGDPSARRPRTSSR